MKYKIFIIKLISVLFGIPINPLVKIVVYLIAIALPQILAYNFVGILYDKRIIHGRKSGSTSNKIFRKILIPLSLIIGCGLCWGIYFFQTYCELTLMITGSIIGTALLCILTVAIMRFIKKHNINVAKTNFI